MKKELEKTTWPAAGKKLQELEKRSGKSRTEIVDLLISKTGLAATEDLLSKWTSETPERRPSKKYMLALLSIFAEYLSEPEATTWALNWGHKLEEQDLKEIFAWAFLKSEDAFVERTALQAEIRTRLKEKQVAMLVLQGIGGAGKRKLAEWVADTLAEELLITADHIVQIECQPEDKVAEIQQEIAVRIGCKLGTTDLRERQRKLRECLKGQRYLVFLINLWHNDKSEDFLENLKIGEKTGTVVFITTSDGKVADRLDAVELVEVGGLTEAEGLELLRKWASVEETKEVVELMTHVKCLPFALKLIGAQLKRGISPSKIISYLEQESDLEQLSLDQPKDRYESLTKCLI